MARGHEVEVAIVVDAREAWGDISDLGPEFRQRLASPFGAAIRGALDTTSAHAADRARSEAKTRGGTPHPGIRMWQSIRILNAREQASSKYRGGLVAGGNNMPYARIQELGGRTKAHVIVPVNANVLAFYWARAGKVCFFKVVNHPGSRIPAKPYLRPALKADTAMLKREISKGMKEKLPGPMKEAILASIKGAA